MARSMVQHNFISPTLPKDMVDPMNDRDFNLGLSALSRRYDYTEYQRLTARRKCESDEQLRFDRGANSKFMTTL